MELNNIIIKTMLNFIREMSKRIEYHLTMKKEKGGRPDKLINKNRFINLLKVEIETLWGVLILKNLIELMSTRRDRE